MKKTFIVLIVLCVFGSGGLIQAQNVVSTAGGDASGSNGSISYTIGQIIYTTNISTSGTNAQGIQQAYEIWVKDGVNESGYNPLISYIFPVPTSDFISLFVKNCEFAYLNYQVFDINGKLLLNNQIEGEETRINLENFLPSTYFLKVFYRNQEIKLFKIIKQ
jgi:Secretion system C-terminal sorting domain